MTRLSSKFFDTIEDHRADLALRRSRIWPSAVPTSVSYPLGERTLTSYLSEWARTRPDRAAVIFEDRVLTYAELDLFSSRLAGYLAAEGIRAGDRVAVYAANCPEFVIAFHAILRLGAVHVPVNPMFRGDELRYELDDSGAEAVIVADALKPTLDAVLPLSVRTVLATGQFPDLLANASVQIPADAGELDALAALNYTGGTTGLPKGCEHTQRDMLYTAASSLTVTGASEDDVSLVFLPIFWIAGENAGLLLPLVNGSTCVLMARWDAGVALDAIEKDRVTSMVAPVDSWIELMDRAAGRDLSSIRTPLAVSFVTKLDPLVRRRFASVSGSDGVLREAAFGMTETHTMDTYTGGLQTDDWDLGERPIFCGLPVPGTDIVVVERETGDIAGIGTEGEIAVHSPSLLRGYYRRPEATDDVLQNGWLLTGDSGTLNSDGALSYLGRHKEMLKVNGMSVFPTELEFLLGRNPHVAGSGVVGVEDPRTGERPIAFVQLIPGATDTADDVVAWCRENMAPYKVPEVRLVDALPLTATGKVLKRELVTRL